MPPHTSTKSHQTNTLWLYGKHACFAALHNKKRQCHEILITESSYERFGKELPKTTSHRIVDKSAIENKVGATATHQGIALRVSPLPFQALEHMPHDGPVVLLDQVTDPQNMGAILRSCAAFNAKALIVTKRHCPQESGALAKAACGALEIVPILQVTNLEKTLQWLKNHQFWCYGLDGYAKSELKDLSLDNKTAFVFGAEGKGLRELTAKRCDALVKLPISEQVESLNVSNAVAITLYEFVRK